MIIFFHLAAVGVGTVGYNLIKTTCFPWLYGEISIKHFYVF